MNHERGFAWLPLIPYIVGGLAIVAAITYVYQLVDNHWATDAGIAEGRKLEKAALQPKIDELAKWKNDAIVLGKEQEAKNRQTEAEREKLNKEVVDAKDEEIKSLSVRYADARKRLRDAARSGGVPQAADAAPITVSCESADSANRQVADLEARILDLLERADEELAKYRALYEWSIKLP